MEYWNLGHTSRNQRGLSLGAQHRIFQSQYRPTPIEQNNATDEENVEQREESPPDTKKARTEVEVEQKESEGTVDPEPASNTPTPVTHSESTDTSVERGVDESSDRSEHEHVETKQEDEKSSDASEVREPSGEEGAKE